MTRGPPRVKMREAGDRLLHGEVAEGTEGVDPLRGCVRQVARSILQVHIEAEATECLGRGHSRRGARRRHGWRHGDEPTGLQTEAGLLRGAGPQLRATDAPFRPVVLDRLGPRTPDLNALVTGLSGRGLSDQDVPERSGETVGDSRLSQTTVSRITRQLTQAFDTWRQRDLSDLQGVSLFLDGQSHAVRQGSDETEGGLAASARLEDGRAVLRHLALGPRESYDAWLGFLQDMTARGLTDPLRVIFDGAPGLTKAIRRVWPRAYRQRCQVHTMRTILATLPRSAQAVMNRLVQQVCLVPSSEGALTRGRVLIARFTDRDPAAMECLEKDREECVTYVRFPKEPHTRIRPTNRLERLYGEGRRRTQGIPRFPTERSCVSLLSATLLTASQRWRGVRMTPAILRALETVRRDAARHPIEAVA